MTRILVIGGYGNFGSFISRRLAREPDVTLIIAGRSGDKAKALAQRWSELVRGFTGGNSSVQQGLNKMYADKGNWPQTFTKPFSDEVGDYIKKAMNAHKISCA